MAQWEYTENVFAKGGGAGPSGKSTNRTAKVTKKTKKQKRSNSSLLLKDYVFLSQLENDNIFRATNIYLL